jgi:hypothetical protein
MSVSASPTSQSEGILNFTQVALKTHLLSICIIDDCRDADVPLLELSLAQLSLLQFLGTNRPLENGHMECHLAVDYYNRLLSGHYPKSNFTLEFYKIV